MLNQPDKATLSAFGVPDEVFNKLELEELKDALTDVESKRVESATNERFYVYPRAVGQYVIVSVKKGKIVSEYQINLNSEAACSCDDFMFNCSPNGISCKHIWRIRFLIKLDCLPSKTTDPYSWIISEIYRDINWLEKQDSDTTESINKLRDLDSIITQLGPNRTDFRVALRKRGHIMMKSNAYSL